MMTANINVTLDNILVGERNSCENCPIALACLRCIPGVTEVGVTNETVEFRLAGVNGVVIAELPHKAKRFVKMFDDAEAVVPINFDIEWGPDEEEEDD